MQIANHYRQGCQCLGWPGYGRTSWQWQPTPTAHDPSPPIILEDAAGGPTIIETDANSAGIGAATGVAAAVWNGLGESHGISTATGLAAAVWAGLGSSDGIGSASGVSVTVWAGVASSDGLATVDGLSSAFAGTVGESTGVATVTGVSGATAGSVGSSDGLATVEGLAASLWSGLGESNGLGTVTGVSAAFWASLATSAGLAEALGVGEAVSGFPTQYDGVRFYDGSSVLVLCLVEEAEAPIGMGGVIKVEKNSTTYALYLVETTDPDASTVRLKTTTGIKAIRLKT